MNFSYCLKYVKNFSVRLFLLLISVFEDQRSLLHWFTLQVLAAAGGGGVQEPEAEAMSPLWLAESQTCDCHLYISRKVELEAAIEV